MDTKLLIILLLLLTNACTNAPIRKTIHKQEAPPLLASSYFGIQKSIIPIDQVYSLTDKQKQNFLDLFNSEQNQSMAPHKRIYQYLDNQLSNFNYHSGTLTASEALLQNQGNCLSLAILTKTLADMVDVEIAYQLVETSPVFQKRGDIILSSQHIRTVLFSAKSASPNAWLIFRGRIYVDYFPTFGSHLLRDVEEPEFKSMYYTRDH